MLPTHLLTLCHGHPDLCSCGLCTLHASLPERRWLVRQWVWEAGTGPVRYEWLNFTRAEADALKAELEEKMQAAEREYLRWCQPEGTGDVEVVEQECPLIEVSHDDVYEVRGNGVGDVAGCAVGLEVPRVPRVGPSTGVPSVPGGYGVSVVVADGAATAGF